MEVSSFNNTRDFPNMYHHACKTHKPHAHCYGRFLGPLVLKLGQDSSQHAKAFKFPNKKIVSKAFENEATQHSKAISEHGLRANKGMEKDFELISTIGSNAKTKHVNGVAHFIEQQDITPPLLGGQQALNEKAMDERIMKKEPQDIKVSFKVSNPYNVESSTLVCNDNLDLETKCHVSWGAANTTTIDNANVNGIMQSTYQSASPPMITEHNLGIIEFLKGKNILITGATGFLGKVLVEKILRVQPDVGRLFLIIKAKDLSHAKERLQNEIVTSSLFMNLQRLHGASYQSFIDRKLSPVIGNLSAENLGIDMETMSEIQSKVEIIVNSAASTTFDERYDHALNLNTKGAQRIVDFGHHCPQLQLLMHVSTAFVNGERKGRVMEKPFKLGCSIANETINEEGDMEPDIDVGMELELVQKTRDEIVQNIENDVSVMPSCLKLRKIEKQLQQAMKDLGMKRAKKYGWQDTYVFTKALGEMSVDSARGKIPIVIIRPSVIESSFKDPFPGWMEGNRMMDPILISYGKGQMPGFLVDPKSVLDVVPVDMVANAMLAAMAKHAKNPGLEVYQVASSVVNPLVFFELARMSREHFNEHPFVDKLGKPLPTPRLELFQDMESFVDAITISSHSMKESLPSSTNSKDLMRRHEQLCQKVIEQAIYLAKLYQPYTFYGGRFDTSKTQQLFASLSYQEKELFGFDVSDIEWDTYIKTIHIPGLRKHVLKGRGSNLASTPHT